MALKFKEGNKVVYPSHGVGVIEGIEVNTVADMEIKTYAIKFDKEKMVLRIPVLRAQKAGLRALADSKELEKVNKTMMLRPKTSRGMWSRRAKEYETKINSGNIISVAEVVRDLHKNVDDPERSYSERIIYENALERLAREVSAVKKLDLEGAQKYIVENLNTKNPYFIKKAEEAALRKAEEEALNAEDDSEDEYEDEAVAA